MTVVHGTVTRGRGNATHHLAAYNEAIATAIGAEPCPGTLNILALGPIRLVAAAASSVAEGERLLWPAELEGHPVWIYRWRHAPLHVLEAISEVNLRRTLSLSDGKRVAVRFADADVAPLRIRERVAWGAVWLGRRTWCYANDTYYHRTLEWCVKMGATQVSPGAIAR